MRAIRIISTEIYEPRGLEAYLTEMARRGYRLDAAGKLLFYFERTEPQDVRYRVEYWLDDLPAQNGWEHVAEIPCGVHIFRAPAGTPLPALCCEEQARRAQYRRYLRRAVRFNLPLAAVLLGVIVGLCVWAGVEAYFDPEKSWWLTAATAALIFAFGYTIFQTVHANRSYREMGKSERPGGLRRYRMGSWLAALGMIVYLGVLGIQVVHLFGQSLHQVANMVPLTEMCEQLDARDLPYFTLEDLGRTDGETWEQLSGVYPHQPLTRAQYSWHTMTPDSNQRLRLDYYAVSLPLLDRALLASIRSEDGQSVQTDRFDALYRIAEDNYLRMTARVGSTVIDLRYTGDCPDKAEALFCETFGR